MSKFKKMLGKVSNETKEIEVVKAPTNTAPKKEAQVNLKGLQGNKEAAKILDMMFILKSAKASIGKDLTASEKEMFASEIQSKTATTISDIDEVIPSGFTGSFMQDAFAMTNLTGIVGWKEINNFGMTDTIGDFGMEAYIVDELGTPTDTNDSMTDVIYLGKKLFAKTYLSYEALEDASIDMLANKRNGLIRAMAVAIEKAILNGQSGDTGIAGQDARTAFRGLRALGLAKEAIDFGGAALTEAQFRAKILEMVEAGGLYTSWEEIEAGNVVLSVPTKVYNAIIDFDTFVDASKSGQGSTLATGRKVSSVFGIPVISNRFYPSDVNASGVVSATPADNTFQSVVLFNTGTVEAFSVKGSAKAESDRDIESQKVIMTSSLRLGFNSQFDAAESAPTTTNILKKNIVSGININV